MNKNDFADYLDNELLVNSLEPVNLEPNDNEIMNIGGMRVKNNSANPSNRKSLGSEDIMSLSPDDIRPLNNGMEVKMVK